MKERSVNRFFGEFLDNSSSQPYTPQEVGTLIRPMRCGLPKRPQARGSFC